MPPANEIQRGLVGAWRMMIGRADGLQILNLTVDGFWNSFYALPLAVPPLLIGWTGFAADIVARPGFTQSRLTLLPRLALVEFGVWVLPLVALALVARPLGIADRFAGYVIASNWGSALLAWIMLPPLLLQITVPVPQELATSLSLVLFILQLVLSWRLTSVAIGRGPAVGTAVFAGMFVLSIALLFALQSLLGIPVSP